MSLVLADKQYPTYILQDDASGNHIEVVPSRGGIVTSWVVSGKEQFYLDKERYSDPKLSIRGGNPVLFPICGNLPDNSYLYAGETYQLKQHGFGRESPWEVVGNTEQSLTIALTANPETLLTYPFDFRVQFTYTVLGNSLLIEQEVSNRTDRSMPFSLGFHPYFAIANKDSIRLDISAQNLWNNVTKTDETYPGKFDFSLPEVDSALYLADHCRSVAMESDQGLLTIKFDQNYRVFVVWAVQGKNFICLEPWTGGRNAMNTGANLIHLSPQSTKSMAVTYEVTPN